MKVNDTHYRSVWLEGSTVYMVNQSLLPHRFEIFESPDHQRTTRAISNFIVRGAGAVGAAAGFAIAQAVIEAPEKDFEPYIETAAEELLKTKISPHTVEICVERVLKRVRKAATPAAAKKDAVLEAQAFADADIKSCQKIGELGASLLKDGGHVLTHGSAGWLSSADWGTSLAPVYTAARGGKDIFVWVGEGRPGLQGARLLAWELGEEHVPFALIADAASGYFMQRGEVDIVIVGCERIACNGDLLARIGTFEKAVLARATKTPFYVCAPQKALDRGCATGKQFILEDRAEDEVVKIGGRDDIGTLHTVTAFPEGARARNPHFDVTPAKYVTGFITERGILTVEKLRALSPEPGA
jgi:methylthioribose-1-phosphate isomerase